MDTLVFMNSNRTLVAYATRGGTTELYANAVAVVLRDEFGLTVDIIDLKKKSPSLSNYRNVVVGCGVRMFRLYSEGVSFLRNDFTGMRVAIFISSLEPREEAIKKYVEKIVGENKTLRPLAVEVFGGRMRFLGRISQDRTDINKSREWARSIAGRLIDVG